jgi:hypothetical protein
MHTTVVPLQKYLVLSIISTVHALWLGSYSDKLIIYWIYNCVYGMEPGYGSDCFCYSKGPGRLQRVDVMVICTQV